MTNEAANLTEERLAATTTKKTCLMMDSGYEVWIESVCHPRTLVVISASILTHFVLPSRALLRVFCLSWDLRRGEEGG